MYAVGGVCRRKIALACCVSEKKQKNVVQIWEQDDPQELRHLSQYLRAKPEWNLLPDLFSWSDLEPRCLPF